MPKRPKETKNFNHGKDPSGPPGKIKIALALRKLFETKAFYSITTAEIARTAGMNEALIYRYFGDKRGLLHHVLGSYLEEAHVQISSNLSDLEGSVNRLKSIIQDTIDIYDKQRVFAKIVLVEARNFPGFFDSQSYQLVRSYARFYTDIIKEGAECGEFRSDIPPKYLRNSIIGMLEHMVMPYIIFNRDIDLNLLTETICTIAFQGTLNKGV